MPSSTSSSEKIVGPPSGLPGGSAARSGEAGPIDWRLLGAIAVLMIVVELVVRTQLVPRSKDLARFRTYDEVAGELVATHGTRIALVGNSATDRGIDTAQLDRLLPPPAKAEKLVADASKINTWLYMVKHLFWDQGRAPDLIVVTFYERNLQDGNPMEIGRVAQYFSSLGDWPALLIDDLTTIDDRVELVLSAKWASFAFRNRIKERALISLVPGYKDFVTHDNEIARHHYGAAAGGGADAGPSAASASTAPATYATLDRFLALAQAHHTAICFIAYPTPPDGPGYTIDPALRARIAAAHLPFVDLSHAPTLLPRHYEDDVHLTPQGATIYTALVAAAITGPCILPR